MLELVYGSQFKKDFKKARKLPIEDLSNIFKIISTLQSQTPLDQKYKDHDLTGNYKAYRECHIKPDLLLIYTVDGKDLSLVRIGSHSELF
ncbi:type II toxin-antitoxin system YafQ family toxin [Lentisphaera profundi]|uniref:Type II toxin-antitoxin system YafQ family toxin n=1 Tax=Lentisphaera profundi TaxID=1658616 RepID=A0ABY7VQS3_9BACT|nr:type II toxin-antitoxin system YafQ family toxin [Lentisphaera profundi]WDE95669.1 type II toxin-antitoxin system YafQ family toxin [Lentisphaera profundi]